MAERNHRLDRALEVGFRLHPGEQWPTALMFLACLSTVGAFIVGRSVRDTLFLSHLSASALPYMYVWASLAVAFSGLLYAQAAARLRLDRLVLATGMVLALSILLARALLSSGRWVYPALYVWVEVMGSVTVIQFWTFANEVYHAREARRLFVLIGAGGTLANVVVGFAVSGLARRVGTEDLLYLCAGLLAAGTVLLLARAPGPAVAVVRPRAAPRVPAKSLLGSAHLRIVAGIAFFTFLTTTFVDYQFKAAAAAHFGQSRDAMTGFFGSFFGLAGLAALAVQLAVTGRLMERLGLVGALAVLPAFLGAGSALVLFAPVLWAATLAKSSDLVFRYTVNDATSQLLYLPLPSGQRKQAKAFIDGILKPGTIALAGLLLAAHRSLSGSFSPVAAAALLCVSLWLASLFRLRAEYVRSLRQNLKKRLPDALGDGALSEDATGVLRRALASAEPRDVECALELAPRVAVDLSAEVGPLLRHEKPRVRLLACEYLAGAPDLRLAGDILRRFDDPDPEVRASAIAAFCAVARDEAVKSVTPFLAAAEPQVRAAAVAGMARHGGLDGALAAGEPLKQLLGSPDPWQRRLATRVLGAIGAKGSYQPVLQLLSDPEPSVRRAAIQAAGIMRSPELLPALVHRLARGETAQAAAEALAAYGPGMERLMGNVLGNPGEDLEIRRNAPRVLGRLATAEALGPLLEHLDDPDPALRRAVDQALWRVARAHPEVPLPLARMRRACMMEVERAYRAVAAAEALRLDPGDFRPPAWNGVAAAGSLRAGALLASALRERVDRAGERVCLLLGIMHPGAELDQVQANLRDPSPARRANALEILDNVLDKPLKRCLVPLLDDRPREAKVREAAALFHLPPLEARDWIGALLGDESPWIAATALTYVAEEAIPVPGSRLLSLLEHPAPFVRESALLAAWRLLSEAERATAVQKLAADPFPPLRARARELAGRMGAAARQATA
jgi:ATP/ADP translocase/HEAT repeat protein